MKPIEIPDKDIFYPLILCYEKTIEENNYLKNYFRGSHNVLQ